MIAAMLKEQGRRNIADVEKTAKKDPRMMAGMGATQIIRNNRAKIYGNLRTNHTPYKAVELSVETHNLSSRSNQAAYATREVNIETHHRVSCSKRSALSAL